MRWNVVGGIGLAVLGIIIILGGLFAVGAMAYYNIRYGPIAPSNSDPGALDQIALTTSNLIRVACLSLSGFVMVMCSWFVYEKRRPVALLLFIVWLALGGLFNALSVQS